MLLLRPWRLCSDINDAAPCCQKDSIEAQTGTLVTDMQRQRKGGRGSRGRGAGIAFGDVELRVASANKRLSRPLGNILPLKVCICYWLTRQ